MASQNHVSKVAIVGAGGNSGRFMTDSLLKTGKHTVTAITRLDSSSKLPDGVIMKKVDYNEPGTIVEALKGQDALVITLSGQTPNMKDIEMQLIDAAGEAGVPWILPNEWAPDTANEALVKDVFVFQPKPEIRKYVADLGKSSYIVMSTGFWYEWSLAIPPAFGFDFANRKVTFFDEGETKISTSTWPQVGRAVAALLSLPVKSEGAKRQACLENFKNQIVYVNSFNVSQKDMLESALRVTDTKEADWTITKEPSKDRCENGLKEIQEGMRVGFAKMMYTRVFYPDGCGDVSDKTINHLLDLPEEDIDEATKRAIERSAGAKWVDGH